MKHPNEGQAGRFWRIKTEGAQEAQYGEDSVRQPFGPDAAGRSQTRAAKLPKVASGVRGPWGRGGPHSHHLRGQRAQMLQHD